MIVRILGEGQFRIDDSAVKELNAFDGKLEAAVNDGDEEAFRAALTALLGRARSLGTPLDAEALEPSELILPYSDARIEDVREMLGDEGLIPG